MQPQRPNPRVRWTEDALTRLREEVGNQRTRLLQAINFTDEHLPREAGGLLDAVSPVGYPNCFLWPKVLFHEHHGLWRLNCIVSKAGWPDVLWVYDVFVQDVE
jgi:hypothetical protein